MIVVEGVDLSGKSTLVSALAKRLDMNPVALGRPPVGERHWDQARTAMRQRDASNTIFDRLVIGSVIYGNYLNDEYNYKPVTSNELILWLKVMEKNKALIIWARCDEQDLRRRYASRGDSYLTLEQILDIYRLYEVTMDNVARSYPHFLKYNSTQWSTEKWIDAYYDELRDYKA